MLPILLPFTGSASLMGLAVMATISMDSAKVAIFLAALVIQAGLWSLVRLQVRDAMAARSGRIGPLLRFFENLRRYVADEDPLPRRAPDYR